MNTTELFAEQVLIGLLVVLMIGLALCDYVGPILTTDKSPVELIVTGGLLLGGAYLIGMVYDRVSDTLLQDLESHCRLHFVSKMKPESDLRGFLESGQDPFTEGKYRIVVLGNSEATRHMDYLRSRIRLTRSLTTVIPGLTFSIVLALDHKSAGSWKIPGDDLSLPVSQVFAIALPLAYLITFCLKLRKKPSRPPKTYESEELKRYLRKKRALFKILCKKRHLLLRPPRYYLVRDEVVIGLSLLALAATILVLYTRSYGQFLILLAGLVLTIIVGWSWWRISLTFYSFLRDYQKYGACQPGS